MLRQKFLAPLCLVVGFLLAGSHVGADELIVDGGFEAGGMGWGGLGDALSLTTDSITGLNSVSSPAGNRSGFPYLWQDFTTSSAVAGTVFSTSFSSNGTAGNSTDRPFNVYLTSSADGGGNAIPTDSYINIRAESDGSLDIHNVGSGWTSLFGSGSVDYSPASNGSGFAENFLSVSFNGFGGTLNYDVTLNGNTVSNVSLFQTGTSFDELSGVYFISKYGNVTIDNVSVLTSAVPEPSALALFAFAGIGMIARRRRS